MMPAKAKPVNAVEGVDHFGSENDARNEPNKSNSATIETSDVSLNSEMKLLTRFGMTWRSACGSTISEVVFHQDSPVPQPPRPARAESQLTRHGRSRPG